MEVSLTKIFGETLPQASIPLISSPKTTFKKSQNSKTQNLENVKLPNSFSGSRGTWSGKAILSTKNIAFQKGPTPNNVQGKFDWNATLVTTLIYKGIMQLVHDFISSKCIFEANHFIPPPFCSYYVSVVTAFQLEFCIHHPLRAFFPKNWFKFIVIFEILTNLVVFFQIKAFETMFHWISSCWKIRFDWVDEGYPFCGSYYTKIYQTPSFFCSYYKSVEKIFVQCA